MGASLPVNLLVEGRRCVVVGDDASKAAAFASRGAETVVISTFLSGAGREMARSGAVTWLCRDYQPGDLDGAFMVVVASEDPELRRLVWEEARRSGVVCNTVDDVEHCTAIFPAIVRRGRLQLAVSTDGASPVVAVKIKQELAGRYGDEYAQLLEILAEARGSVSGRGTAEQRRTFWYSVVDSGLLELVRAGRTDEAREQVNRWLSSLPA